MPVYQYACTECGEQLEVRQSFTDDALTVCPTCSGRLRKVLSAVGVVFKGSGFYRNDSRAEARTDASSKDGAGSGDGKGGGEAAGSGETSGDKGDKGGKKVDAAPAAKSNGAASREPASAASRAGSRSGQGASSSTPDTKKPTSPAPAR